MGLPATGRRSPRQQDGLEAEELAARFLAARGVAILERNYRTRFGEIDLIARDGATLVFVEVRRRRSSRPWGGAAASVDPAKRRRLEAAAQLYLAGLGRGAGARPQLAGLGTEPPCRFDVVTLQGGEMSWLRAAFLTR